MSCPMPLSRPSGEDLAYMHDWDKAIEYSSILIDREGATFPLSSTRVASTNTGLNDFGYMWQYDAATELLWGARLHPYLIRRSPRYGFPEFQQGLHSISIRTMSLPSGSSTSTMKRTEGILHISPRQRSSGARQDMPESPILPLLIKYFGNINFINSYTIYHVTCRSSCAWPSSILSVPKPIARGLPR